MLSHPTRKAYTVQRYYVGHDDDDEEAGLERPAAVVAGSKPFAWIAQRWIWEALVVFLFLGLTAAVVMQRIHAEDPPGMTMAYTNMGSADGRRVTRQDIAHQAVIVTTRFISVSGGKATVQVDTLSGRLGAVFCVCRYGVGEEWIRTDVLVGIREELEHARDEGRAACSVDMRSSRGGAFAVDVSGVAVASSGATCEVVAIMI
jgi:hypothetical protein